VHEANGYIVQYAWQGKDYINIKGTVYGPFDQESLVFATDNNDNPDYSKFYYSKTEDNNTKYYLHYKGEKRGPFEDIYFSDKDDYAYLYLLANRWYAHTQEGKNKMALPSDVKNHIRQRNGKYYVTINGKVSGGYDNAGIYSTESGKYAYYYKENGKYYVVTNVNGTEKISGGYGDVWNIHLTESGKYAYYYKENWKNYIVTNINGTEKISRGYDNVGIFHFTESGKYAYCYEENGKYYGVTNINGTEQISRGYDGAWDFHLTESRKYVYFYRENGKYYVVTNINGTEKISGGYDYVMDNYLTESGKYAYCYKENGKEYVVTNINGTEKISGGYGDVWNIHLTESGKYVYYYYENGKMYLNINGEDKREYPNISDFTWGDDGKYSFYYEKEDGKIYKSNNDKETETAFLSGMPYYDETSPPTLFCNRNYNHYYDESENGIEIYSTNKEHSLYSHYDFNFVVINGEDHGYSPALYAWYDKTKHAFIWNAIEGKELVLYEFKLN
jgi:molybdate-binding protein